MGKAVIPKLEKSSDVSFSAIPSNKRCFVTGRARLPDKESDVSAGRENREFGICVKLILCKKSETPKAPISSPANNIPITTTPTTPAVPSSAPNSMESNSVPVPLASVDSPLPAPATAKLDENSPPVEEDESPSDLNDENQEPEQEQEDIPLPDPEKAIASIASHRITKNGVLEYRVVHQDQSSSWMMEDLANSEANGPKEIALYFNKKRKPIFAQLHTQLQKQQILLGQPHISLRKAKKTLQYLLGEQSPYLHHAPTQTKLEAQIKKTPSLPKLLDFLDDLLDHWNTTMSPALQ